jgi:protease I
MDQDKPLAGKTVALLVANGFAEEQMTETQKALVAAGATPKVVSPEIGLVNGWHEGTWGHNFYVEIKPGNVLPSQYDGLVVPGGERSMAALLENAHARRIVKGMLEAGKPVGILGEAVELLVRAEASAGRTVTGAAKVREPLEAGGATWSDAPVVTDGKLITAAGSEHLPAFIETFIAALQEAAAGEREAA